jgi:LysM repeat protein
VREGDTCASVAILYGLPLDVLVQLNAEKCAPGQLIRPGDPLLVPAATPTPGPTVTVGAGTPSATPECPRLHVVHRGETGLGIAELYSVPFPLIERSNPQVDFAQLPVNQVLQIPCAEPGPTSTPTVDPNASPTAIPKYAAPALLSPSDGAEVTGAVVALQWTAVSLLRADEVYAVRLRSLSDTRALESLFTRTTVVRLDEAYAPTADIPVREYSWEVTVVRPSGSTSSGETRYAAASQPSVQRNFRWVLLADEISPVATVTP